MVFTGPGMTPLAMDKSVTKQVEQESREAMGSQRLWPAVRVLLRTRIVAGLITVIPIWVTWIVIKFVFDTMKSASEPVAEKIAKLLAQSTESRVAYTFDAYMAWIVPVLAVLLTLFFLYLLGLWTASVIGGRIIHRIERLFEKVPLVKTIYRSTKQVVITVGGDQTMNVKRVVLIEFPRQGMKCIGFLTSVIKDVATGRDMATVFIATTPNPTIGYLQIVPLDEVSETNWSVEEAVKLVMSGGILSPPTVPFDMVHPVRFAADSDPTAMNASVLLNTKEQERRT